jgi:hypothetical protein
MMSVDKYVAKCAGASIMVLYGQLSQVEPRLEFIDPICGIVKLAILAYKPIGTKLSLHENRINIQDPSKLQGLHRMFASDDRDQLHQLRSLVIYFRGLELGYNKLENIEDGSFTQLTQLTIRGLNNLKITYEKAKKSGSLIKNCIDDYIKILAHPYSQEQYTDELNLINKPTLFVIYGEFAKKWKQADLSMINNLFKFAETASSENVSNEIANAVDHFIRSKDIEIDSLRPD